MSRIAIPTWLLFCAINNTALAEIPLYNEDGLFNPLQQQSKPSQVVRQNPMGTLPIKPI